MENESKTENKNQVARLLEKHGDRVFRTAFMYLKNYQIDIYSEYLWVHET